MQPLTYFATYFVVWWICLFVVLPFRVHNQIDAGVWEPGTERGAPATGFRIWPKLLITTALSIPITAVLLWLLSNEWLREYWK